MSNKFGYRTTALEVVSNIDLRGKNVIVTGGYSGIGLETVRALASAGANVTIAGRDIARAREKAADLVSALVAAQINVMELDLGSLASIKRFAVDYSGKSTQLHILVNNAAVMACPKAVTADGFELQFGTNHLGHVALTRLLLPLLRDAAGARVICLSSTGHMISPVVFEDINFLNRPYDPWLGYGQAKTANSLTAVAIQNLYYEHKIEAFAVHPGGIMTALQRHMNKEDIEARGWVDSKGKVNELFKTVEQGASTSVWAATALELKDRGGVYLEDCGIAQIQETMPESRKGVMSYAVDRQAALALWQLSETMILDKNPGYFD